MPKAFTAGPLPTADAATATAIKVEAMAVGQPPPGALLAADEGLVTQPGVERWPVKTGSDPDKVDETVVDTTVEEMVRFPRPGDMMPVTGDFPGYQEHRAAPVETTVWRLSADVIAVKQEADGDYHLVLQGASGDQMIAEIPHPDPPYVEDPSPWNDRIKKSRQAADDNLVNGVRAMLARFVPLDGKLVPPASFTVPPPPPQGLVDAASSGQAAFKTAIKPTPVTITGVGFFDKVHGQAGVSSFNGIEIHPVLDITFG